MLLRADKTLWLHRPRARRAAAVQVSRDELVARIRAKQAARPDQPVVIAADRSARYEDVLAILDVLQRNGAKKVGLLARPPRRADAAMAKDDRSQPARLPAAGSPPGSRSRCTWRFSACWCSR